MSKIVLIGNDIDLNYTDTKITTSGLALVNAAVSNLSVYNTGSLTSSTTATMQTEVSDTTNTIITLGEALSNTVSKLTGVNYGKVVNIEGSDRYATHTLLQNYLNLPSTKTLMASTVPVVISQPETTTTTTTVVVPQFLEAEPTFNETLPTFTSTLESVTKYSYYFGIDSLVVSKNDKNSDCCFASSEFDVSDIISNGYIELDASYFTDGFSSAEFYIIDGQNEIPIMPYKDTQILNEKIFFNMYSRFTMDTSSNIVVSKNLAETSLKFNSAIALNDGLYTVSYTPVDCYKYTPVNNLIRVKVIIRSYDIAQTPPYIDYINILKFGGTNLWLDNI